MGTEYEVERREQELQRREVEQQRRDREAEMAEAPPAVLKTPRDRVAGYVQNALRALRVLGPDAPVVALSAAQEAARWLDMAREELDSPAIVDGAARLEGHLLSIGDAVNEGELGVALYEVREALDLLGRQVRYPEADGIPVPTDDFDTSGQQSFRDAVRAVLKRHEGSIGVTDANLLRAEVVDAIIDAARTGV